ncbi:MAG: hypothetical protein U9R17_07235 [Thermodesulfobacteriota bacterium]|nr:hypothetical protein [Thermodesulfobacteriota bacterium]
MPVLTDIRIEFDAEEIILSLQKGRKPSQTLLSETKKSILEAKNLLRPAIVYDWFKILRIVENQVILSAENPDQEIKLNIGQHIDLIKKAELAMISVVTIGSNLDERVRALNRSGENLSGYLLDSIGVVALSKIREIVTKMVQREAYKQSWGIGPILGPGSLAGWPLSGQADLCALLPIEQIGVYLNETSVLVPLKSASAIKCIGPEYGPMDIVSVCQLCTHKDTCWRRHD